MTSKTRYNIFVVSYTHTQIRHVACDQLYTLSQSDTSAYPDLQKPNLFLLKVVLTAQLPLWSPTSIMRGINQRLICATNANAKDHK